MKKTEQYIGEEWSEMDVMGEKYKGKQRFEWYPVEERGAEENRAVLEHKN